MSEIKRRLATIEKISEISPIDGADAIEKASIRGWNIVVKKEEFKKDDLCIYCEIDSLMPDREEFEFLRPRGFRIRTIKLRGQVSQGIIFPLSILNSVGKITHNNPIHNVELFIPATDPKHIIAIVEDTDVTDILGVTKYDPPIPAKLAGIAKGNFPSHSIKTDEERIQNLINRYESYKKESWVATEKLDGTSMTVYIDKNGTFGISSRNLDLTESESNTFWRVANALDLRKKMSDFMFVNKLNTLTLQGELIGEGIQKNKYKLKGQTVKFFRAFDQEVYEFYPYETFLDMMKTMKLETVPIIDLDFKLPDKYEDAIPMADGVSALCDTPREGIVFVARNPSHNDSGRLSFKIISNKFLLKHDE